MIASLLILPQFCNFTKCLSLFLQLHEEKAVESKYSTKEKQPAALDRILTPRL